MEREREAKREKVWRAYNEALAKDRAKSNVSKISELGLVEMTRKRTRESLSRKLTEACFYCEGKGYLKSKTTTCYEILREVRRQGDAVREDTIVVACHPEIADLMATADLEYVEELEKRLQKRILVKARGSFHMEQYEIMGKKASEKPAREKGKAGAKDDEASKDGDVEGDEEARTAR